MFKCIEGCGECCGIVPIDKRVWERVKHKAQRKVVEIQEIRKAHRVDEFEVWVVCEGLKCVFLNERTKKCMIYEDRPQVCRNYGIGKFDALSCPYLKPNGKRRTEAMTKRIQRQINHNVDDKMRRWEKWMKK